MVTTRGVLAGIEAQFTAAGLDTPALDARLLAQEALALSHTDIILHGDRPVSEDELETLSRMTARRLAREPVSRILGRRAFWKSEFKISPATLDPRPDSETLVEAALDLFPPESPLSILDLGTGTGCLLLSLLQEFPQAYGLGIDIDPDAVRIAADNAIALSLTDRCAFMETTWTDLRPAQPFALVVSNPPYIREADIATLAPEVRVYDPQAALSGGVDGLGCYRAIAAALPRLLAPEGALVLEIGYDQAASVTRVLDAAGISVLQTLTDLAGQDRCLVARWK